MDTPSNAASVATTVAAPDASTLPSAVASSSAAVAVEGAPPDPLVITLPRSFVKTDFEKKPFFFTAAFDGSMRYSLWLREINFARRMKAAHERAPHFTFFVNACYFTTDPGPSDVGKAMTRSEVLIRRALAQIAINEGHEIGDHTMGHHDGRNWSKEEWARELDLFHGVMDFALFEPVRDEDGRPLFPRFRAIEGAAPRAYGAACAKDADCDSGSCLTLEGETSLCTQACNLKQKCPQGSACGAPMFREDTDVCLPLPVFPVEHAGQTLFDAKGAPNLKNKALVPYAIRGFRAPYLAANDAMYEALAARGYQYDTSQSASPSPPFRFQPRTERRTILELALMVHDGVSALPMDYNYAKLKVSGARMQADYERAILASYGMGKLPFNIGHHFAEWEGGAYIDALERSVEMVQTGCPDATGEARCPGGEVVSFRELANLSER